MAEKRKRRKPKDWYRPKGSQQGKPLSNLQEEMIVQSYAISGNKAEVARQLHLSVPTITRTLRKADTDVNLQRIRAGALEDLAGKVHGKTLEVLDSISGEDLESGLIKKYDAAGNLESVKAYGPSLMQKVTSAAILTDKIKVIHEAKRQLETAHNENPASLPVPQDIDAALKQIGERIQRLRIIDLQFASKNPEITSRVQDVAQQVALDPRIEDAVFETLDLDNPG